MDVVIREALSTQQEQVFKLLVMAEEGDERVRAALGDAQSIAYSLELPKAQVVGAALVQWEKNASEIIYIAVDPQYRRQGFASRLLRWLQAEARHHETTALLVGTGNCSFDNIALYQKCAFRMDHVRRDYFAYIQPPISENGIPLQDMLVLRYEVV